MKYLTNADLPEAVQIALPNEGQTIWRTIFEAYMDKNNDQKTALAVAWAGLREQGWEKTKDGWQLIEKNAGASFDDVNTINKKANYRTVTIKFNDGENSLIKMLEYIKTASKSGHSFPVVADPHDERKEQFYFDGDGDFRIISIEEEVEKDSPTVSGVHVNKPMCEEDEEENKKSFVFKIAGTNNEKRLAFGWSVISRDCNGNVVWDLQNDSIDPEDLEELSYKYVRFYRDSGELHNGSSSKAVLIESVVTTLEKQRVWGIPSGVMPIGWWTGFYVMDDAVWEKVKNGEYSAFSIEGSAIREKV